MSRIRTRYLWLSLLTVALGLASRRFGAMLPGWVATYAGDVLWALLVFWVMRVWRPQGGRGWAAGRALGFAYLVEISQCYHPAWLQTLRRSPLGGLLLGHGFLWSDLLCYTGGVLLGVALERVCFRPRSVADA